jgi:hypothetical protein
MYPHLAPLAWLLLTLWCACCCGQPSDDAAAASSAQFFSAAFHRYVIVGAGPAGLQMAHYLETAGRDYIVLDRAAAPASFFTTYPRFRQLISINKPHAGSAALDAVMRHDWNSLLSEPSHAAEGAGDGTVGDDTVGDDTAGDAATAGHPASSAPVPCLAAGGGSVAPPGTSLCRASTYSSTDPAHTSAGVPPGLRFPDVHPGASYYPHADQLVSYLRGWAGAVPLGGCHNRTRGALRLALGVDVVRVSRPPGWAAGARGSAAAPRFLLRAADGRAFTCAWLIWAGGLGAVNTAEGENVAQAALRYDTFPTQLSLYANASMLVLGSGNAAFEVANALLPVAAAVQLMGRSRRVRLATETHYPGDVRRVHSTLLESYLLKSGDALLEANMQGFRLQRTPSGRWTVLLDAAQACLTDSYGRELDRCFPGREYDAIISCPGWHFEGGAFTPEVRPARSGKYPALGPGYEAPGVEGLFFAGTVAHAADFRVSSGGFIHGFRYVVRALHRHLEEVEQAEAQVGDAAQDGAQDGAQPKAGGDDATPHTGNVAHPRSHWAPWPRRPFRGLRSLAASILDRLNGAAGPFQMFGSLADVVVLAPPGACAGSGEGGAFGGPGPAAPLHDPASFPDSHTRHPLLLQVAPRPLEAVAGAGASRAAIAAAAARRADDACLEAALRGALFEEVPMRLAPLKVAGWGGQVRAAQQQPRPYFPQADYITVTLEFGGGGGLNPPDAGAGRLGGLALQQQVGEEEMKKKGGLEGAEGGGQPLQPWPGSGAAAEAKEEVEEGRAWDPTLPPRFTVSATGERLVYSRRLRAYVPQSVGEGEMRRMPQGFPSGGMHPSDGGFAGMHPSDGSFQGDSPVDPYSTSRANATYWDPHNGRFLHPVIRFFSPGASANVSGRAPGRGAPPGRIPRPTLELHLLEDFNQVFTSYGGHLLSLARFLQEVAARRARAAAAYPAGASAAAAALSRPSPTPAGASSPHANMLRAFMDMPSATLYLDGLAFPGGLAWFHALSCEAFEALMRGARRRLALHALLVAPSDMVPPSGGGGTPLPPTHHHQPGGGDPTAGADGMRLPGLSPAQHRQLDERDAAWHLWHTRRTAPPQPGALTADGGGHLALPLAIIVLRTRGEASVQPWLEATPRAAPGYREFDAQGRAAEGEPYWRLQAQAEEAWAREGAASLADDAALSTWPTYAVPTQERTHAALPPPPPSG